MALPSKFMSINEVAQLVVTTAFYGWRSVVVTAIIWAESRGNIYAVNMNPDDLSLDLGLCQWNTRYTPMTTQQAFNPQWSVEHMYHTTDQGRENLTWWAVYQSPGHGAYWQFVPAARLAARKAGAPV